MKIIAETIFLRTTAPKTVTHSPQSGKARSTHTWRPSLYTKAEVRAADAVRQYSMAMGGMDVYSEPDGLTFTSQDVVRAFRIYGPSLEVDRGGSVKIKSPGPVSDMVTDSKVTMQVDINVSLWCRVLGRICEAYVSAYVQVVEVEEHKAREACFGGAEGSA